MTTTTAKAKPRTRKKPEAQDQASQPEPVKPEPVPWRMPDVKRGQIVTLYPGLTNNPRNAEVAIVSRVEERQITVGWAGAGYDQVYHKDDPRLKKNPDLRKEIQGVWEHTEETLELQELRDRVILLESQIEDLLLNQQ